MTSKNDFPQSGSPTIRQRRDIPGCGCVRCQGVDYDVVTRSFAGAFAWGSQLLVARPSVVVAFLVVGAIQLLALYSPTEPALSSALLGFVGVFVGRGYVGVVGATRIGRGENRIANALETVARRIPAFVGAFALVALALVGIVLFVAVGLATAIEVGLGAVGATVESAAIDVGLLLFAAALLTAALVKFCFVPEACFVGGYGPVASIRASWQLTSLHRRKAIVLTAGLFALFGVGLLLDTQFAATDRPVVLSITFEETTVAIRSLGLSIASVPRLLVDALLSALYYAVFTHQYVHGIFDR